MIKKLSLGVLCLMFLTLVFIPSDIMSQCGSPQIYRQPVNYYQPTYSAPVTYQQNYQYAQVVPIVYPVIVPAAVFQYMPAYTNQINLPNKNFETELSLNKDNLELYIKEIIRNEITNNISTNNGPPQLILNSKINNTPSNTTQNNSENTLQQVANLLADHGCIECHTTGKKTAGDISLFTKNGEDYLFNPNTSPKNIYNAVRYNNSGTSLMPPTSAINSGSASRLSQEEVEIINRWSVSNQ